jgi:tRNA(Ile)-lysidine synthetase-like protein
MGGGLIRQLIAELRKQGLSLPITSDILIACSGGADSVALAVLVARYGRKITGQGGCKLTLLHVNHGWRGESSNADAAWVRDLARDLGVGFRLGIGRSPSSYPPGASLEAEAREDRRRIFAEARSEQGALAEVWTAHHQDDLAATVLWRLLTGTGDTHGAGILPFFDGVRRPLLFARKAELCAFLEEEGIVPREDSSNSDPRFQRNRIQPLLRSLEREFPRAVGHLAEMGRRGAEIGSDSARDVDGPLGEAEWAHGLLGTWSVAGGPRLRRGQIDEMRKNLSAGGVFWGPQGWRAWAEETSEGKKRLIVEAPRDVLGFLDQPARSGDERPL